VLADLTGSAKRSAGDKPTAPYLVHAPRHHRSVVGDFPCHAVRGPAHRLVAVRRAGANLQRRRPASREVFEASTPGGLDEATLILAIQCEHVEGDVAGRRSRRARTGHAAGEAMLEMIETQPAVDPHHRLPVQDGPQAEIQVGHGGQIGKAEVKSAPRCDHNRGPLGVRTTATRNPSNFTSYRQPPAQAVSSGTVSADRARARPTGPASPGGRGRAAAMHSGCAVRGRPWPDLFRQGSQQVGSNSHPADQHADGGRSTMGWK